MWNLSRSLVLCDVMYCTLCCYYLYWTCHGHDGTGVKIEEEEEGCDVEGQGEETTQSRCSELQDHRVLSNSTNVQRKISRKFLSLSLRRSGALVCFSSLSIDVDYYPRDLFLVFIDDEGRFFNGSKREGKKGYFVDLKRRRGECALFVLLSWLERTTESTTEFYVMMALSRFG